MQKIKSNIYKAKSEQNSFNESQSSSKIEQNSDDDQVQNQSKNSNLSNIEREIKDTQKAIDWSFKAGELNFTQKLYPQYKQRNQIKTPYTYTLIEDAMYVDEGVVITLQYHIFNDNQDHIQLTDVTHEKTIDGKSTSKLNTDNYQKEGQHPMSIFTNPPKNFEDRNDIIVENNDVGEYMTAEEKEINQSFKIEGVLCFWRAYVSGKMEKMCEKSFTTGMPFAYTRSGNMQLQITNDKKVLTLTYISNYSDKQADDSTIIRHDSQVKIMGWSIDVKTCTFTKEIHSLFNKMNKGLSDYFRENMKNIHLIRSIKLTANRLHLVLTYNQQSNRIDSLALETGIDPQMENAYVQPKHDSKKIARKFAIFEVKSGKLLFEYGGSYQNLQLPDQISKIYNLGLAIQDTKYQKQSNQNTRNFNLCDSIDEDVVFFCAGNFVDWSQNIKNLNQKQEKIQSSPSNNYEDFNWTLAIKRINLNEIIQSGQTPPKRKEWVNKQIIDHCYQLKQQIIGQIDCFQFRQKCITFREDWEASIIIQVNSHFDQLGVLNIPQVSNSYNPRSFFLYSLSDGTSSFNNIFGKISEVYSMPQIIKQLPKEGLIQHGRNSQLKKDMYIIVQPPGLKGYGECIKLDKNVKNQNLQIQIHQNHQPYNTFDIWCYEEHYMKGQPSVNGEIDQEDHLQVLDIDKRQVMQICSIDTDSLQLEIITKIPRKVSLSRFDFLVKSSDTLQQQQAEWPFFAYNLGIEKIALIHLTRQQKPREYIYKLQNSHKFLCFCEFNDYKDAGFFGEGLLIEACVKFSFLTECKDQIYLNILLIDPYHHPMQFSLFTSSHVVFKKEFKVDDMIETAFVIPNKRSQEIVGKDKQFSIYLITQYKSVIKRCKFKDPDPNQINEDDSDYGLDFTDEYQDSLMSQPQKYILEHVYAQIDEKNFLYYVIRQGQICKIMEINPRKSNIRNHHCIYELKSNNCQGFSASQNGNQFIFIDHNKTSYVLQRIIDSRNLRLVQEKNMNETFQSDFESFSYDPMIINPKYIIQRNSIFYLWKNDPYPNGIFMMEDISETDKNQFPASFKNDIAWFQGPIAFMESNQFAVINRVRKFYAYLNVLALPESTTKTLMVDHMNMIDISTFLSNGDILLRCGHRYLVFDKDGFFKSQVSFNDNENLKGEEIKENNSNQNTQKKYKKKQKKKIDKVQEGLFELGLQDQGQSSDEFEQSQQIGQHNKMELIQFSADNKKFLFLNKISQRMKVYELVNKIIQKDNHQTEEYQFQKMFSLDYKNSELLKETKKFMHGEHKFPFRDYLDKCLTINVAQDGSVDMILISQPDRQVDEDMKTTFFEIVISLFKVDFQNGRYKVITHNIKEQIHRPSSEDIEVCHSYEKDYYQNCINDVKLVQQRLPHHLKDGTDLEILQDNLLYLEERRRRLIHASINNGVVLLWQGSWFRWTKIFYDEEEGYKINQLQKIDVSLESLSEIMSSEFIIVGEKIDSGFKPLEDKKQTHVIQILLKNHSIDQYDNKYIFLTWDLNEDQQYSILEEADEYNSMLELNLIKGMHQKLNYFQDQHSIIDLDQTNPILITRNQKENEKHRSNAAINKLLLKFQNQRKVFENNTRYLQNNRPANLIFSYSYLNLRLWNDINYLKNKISLFKEVVSLSDFTVDFDGQSMFHVYIQKSEVIQYIHDLFKEKKQAGKLTGIEHYIPLLIMNTDDENYTAFFRCIQAENFKSFELLCSLCTDMQASFITRNIIRSLPWMLVNESQAVLNYFDYNTYTPINYQEPIILPWPEKLLDITQVVFPTKTTLLTTKEILEKLASKTEKKQDEIQQVIIEKKPAVLEDEETKLIKHLEKLKKDVKFIEELEKANKVLSSKPRDLLLTDNILDDSLTAEMKGKNKNQEKGQNSKNKRVLIRVIDFDFLFQNDNSVTLIQILAGLETNKILTRSSIKAFVGLMWQEYQPAIFWRIFLLYFVYLFMTIYLCAGDLPYLWNKVTLKNQAIASGTYTPSHEADKLLTYLNILISFLILTFFAQFEFLQLIEAGFVDYFGSIWNFVDVTQMVLNYFLLIYATYFCIFEESFASPQQVVRIAAFGNFLMWFKMFYWMRLFQSTARYVQLISQTLADLTYFIIMVMIIILTFATFFYIININGKAVGLSYIPDYGLNPFLTAIISVYMITLGDFAYSDYSAGPNITSCWFMFLACTFFNCVMFMNMLIAIMSKTFEEVTATEEENGLQQQIGLIADYISLLDHNIIWGDCRYIMEVKVVEQGEEQDQDVKDLLKEMKQSILIKNDRNSYNLQKKIQFMEGMLDLLQSQQIEIKNYMQQLISTVKEIQNYDELEENIQQNLQQNSDQDLQNNDQSEQKNGFFGLF